MESSRERRLLIQDMGPGEHTISGSKAHYLRDVLRVEKGQALILFDGKGIQRNAVVKGLDRHGVTLDVSAGSHAVPPPKPELIVGLAMPKSTRSDWVVEKLTEFGVAGIVWLACERSVGIPHPGSDRTERWQRLSEAAAHQCGRLTLPSIEGPIPFAEFMKREVDERYIALARGRELPTPLPFNSSALLAIGPEGGFTTAEKRVAEEANCVPLRLSRHILRVESAAMVGAAMLLAPFDPV
jgi:16S rRNA (uracil1498-N3)-methyltransferase